jgi:hypothetical protein
MYFQTLDDKTECVGVYKGGRLHFEDFPADLHRTWNYAGTHAAGVDYAWLWADGLSLSEACPEEMQDELVRIDRKMRAFYKSFKIAKLNFNEHCIFDLIPHDALLEFCEVKNKITQHVFENLPKPKHYEFLKNSSRLLHQIRYQGLNLDISDCKSMFTATNNRIGLKKILAGARSIDYNLFGTVTGRLSTHHGSFPILTMKKDFRRILKPQNDWFISLDYNGAEVRTVLALLGHQQPASDVHEWNIQNVFKDLTLTGYPTRDEAKVLFFGWLYNPDSTIVNSSFYDRDSLLDKYYTNGYIKTMFGREISVSQRKAFNYLIQSTTSDLVIERSCEINKMLKNTKSHISHIVHDEIVIDLHNDDKPMIQDIKDTFSNNRLGSFMVNLKAGKNYYDLEDLKL